MFLLFFLFLSRSLIILVMQAINTAGSTTTKPLPIRDTLFFKIQGDDASIKLAAKSVQTIVKKYGSDKFEFASTDQEAENLWQNRKYALTSTMGTHARVQMLILILIYSVWIFRSASWVEMLDYRCVVSGVFFGVTGNNSRALILVYQSRNYQSL